ncbi:tyrosine-type recombinase/integrase [Promicromonospora iranensis]|uniref:Integrase n=1 Tax=Promicromonospora iranensis TaxID=1105144 RepID=A0ABU2CIN2_9MICO|nr:tyrosine-type recombinase/integrase [Promicromonospora iranensis]MDR7381184.1 integrase [Promicromonospora iranensis]
MIEVPVSGAELPADSRSAAGIQAAQTRAASGPTTKPLSPPAAVAPDAVFGPRGRILRQHAYDLGSAPPVLPSGASGEGAQGLGLDDAIYFTLDRVLEVFPSRKPTSTGVRRILQWLDRFDGDTWEQRWLASGADLAPRTWRSSVTPRTPESSVAQGMNALLVARVLRPSYGWQLASKAGAHLPQRILTVNEAEQLERLRALPAYRSALFRHQYDAEACLSRVLIRTGKRLHEIRGDDLLFYADVVRTSGRNRREHLAWELLVTLGPFAGEPLTLRAAWSAKGNTRQHSVETLVDRYGLPAGAVRDLLVDYLRELKPSMDYGSLEGWAYRLVRLFWWEVLQINPHQADLRLASEVAAEWRERLAVTTDGLPRREIHSILFAVRGMYRDLAEWSHDEPARWGPWVAPCPVSRHESRNASKAKRRQQSRMQNRTRALTPLLPALVAEAVRRRDWAARLLTAGQEAGHGQRFVVDGSEFELHHPPPRRYERDRPSLLRARIVTAAPDLPLIRVNRHGLVDITAAESDGFWAWAAIETLRHTGIRVEELLELTQLSLRHHTAASTGTLVPLLHIVPSKNDMERLIPMTPELVAVLVAVQRRAKDNSGRIPLSIRYDPHEKVHGEPFPHLFVRRIGTRNEVISPSVARRLIVDVAVSAGLRDAGEPIHFTPHDFRRLFTTEMVSTGLPLHITATLLGHLNLDTTRGYTAVFPEEVIAAHQHFIERRRATRTSAELRTATGEEWADFENHFLLRKVALGDCHRPYGTPCVHEHACVKCRFLRVDPAQLPRIEDMTANATKRIAEAKERVWLGEVAALEDSLKHLRKRRTEAEQQLKTATASMPAEDG